MVRAAESIGSKWDSALKEAIPDAKTAYGQVLATIPGKITAAKGKMKTAYAAAIDAPNFDARVTAGLAPGKADVAYNERLDQIAVTGTTEAQQAKMVEETKIRRRISTQIPAVIALFTGTSGNLKFPDGISNITKKTIVNRAAMKYRTYFSERSSGQDIYDILKTNHESLDDIALVP